MEGKEGSERARSPLHQETPFKAEITPHSTQPNPLWFITDTSIFRLVWPLEFPYMVHKTSLIWIVRWTIGVRYSVSVINHTGCSTQPIALRHKITGS